MAARQSLPGAAMVEKVAALMPGFSDTALAMARRFTE